MLRRAASGHIAATQVPKFAAASRIAPAVIRGWPEAPSSPLQGGAAPPAAGAVWAGAEVPGGGPDGAVGPAFGAEPVKMLSKKFRNPPPEDCARASPASSSAAAMMTALVRPFADVLVRRAMSLTRASLGIPPSGGLVTVSNSLTKARFCCRESVRGQTAPERKVWALPPDTPRNRLSWNRFGRAELP